MAGVGVYLFWAGYAVWIMLFTWIAWRGNSRVLLMLGAAMIFAFVACYALFVRATTMPGDQVGPAILLMFAAAVLIVPLVVAGIVYPIGRRWER